MPSVTSVACNGRSEVVTAVEASSTPPTGSRDQQYLSDVLTRFHQRVGHCRLAQRERAVSEGMQLALGPHGPALLAQCGDDAGLLCHATRPQGRSSHGQVLSVDRAEIRLHFRATHEGDEAQAPFMSQELDLARDVVAADHVEDCIDTASAGGFLADGDKVLGAVVDRDVGTEVAAGRALFVRAGGGKHLAAPGFRELDRGDADTAGTALDQKSLAGLEMHPVEDV